MMAQKAKMEEATPTMQPTRPNCEEIKAHKAKMKGKQRHQRKVEARPV